MIITVSPVKQQLVVTHKNTDLQETEKILSVFFYEKQILCEQYFGGYVCSPAVK